MMTDVKIVWQHYVDSYADDYHAFVGKWQIATIYWNPALYNNNLSHQAFVQLPGIETCLGHHTAEDAKAQVEQVVRDWFQNALRDTGADDNQTGKE